MTPSFCRALLPLACLTAFAASAGASSSLFPDPLPDHYRTGRRFTTALEQPISGSWKGVPLRSLLRRLSHEGQIAILLDRRVDPDRKCRLQRATGPCERQSTKLPNRLSSA